MGKEETLDKIEIVKFSDGSYAIRKDYNKEDYCYEYLDLDNLDTWCASISSINKYCKGHKWGVVRAYKKYKRGLRDDKDSGTPINMEGIDY